MTVVNGADVAVNGLSGADFAVEIDGEPAAIQSAVAKTVPLAVALVVDRSGSMGVVATADGQNADFRATVLYGLFPALSRADGATLGVFGISPIFESKLLPPTKEAIEAALRDIDALESPIVTRRRNAVRQPEFLPPVDSPLWDAADQAVRSVAADDRHRVVVMVTDGRAAGNVIDPEALAERAVRARTAIAFVHQGPAEYVPQDGTGRAAVRSDVALRWVADATGGIYLADATARGQNRRFNVPAALVKHALETHRQVYQLRVVVAASNRTRSLRVTAKNPSLRVLSPASLPVGR